MPKASRFVHPQTGEVVWTDTPAAYGGWTLTATATRMPERFEDKAGDRLAKDAKAQAEFDEECRLAGMSHRERHDEAIRKALEQLRGGSHGT